MFARGPAVYPCTEGRAAALEPPPTAGTCHHPSSAHLRGERQWGSAAAAGIQQRHQHLAGSPTNIRRPATPLPHLVLGRVPPRPAEELDDINRGHQGASRGEDLGEATQLVEIGEPPRIQLRRDRTGLLHQQRVIAHPHHATSSAAQHATPALISPLISGHASPPNSGDATSPPSARARSPILEPMPPACGCTPRTDAPHRHRLQDNAPRAPRPGMPVAPAAAAEGVDPHPRPRAQRGDPP